jgi:hypothetical protein
MEMEDEGDMPVWGRNAKRLRTGYNAQYGDEDEEEMENEDEDEDNDADEGQREMQVYDIRGVPVGFPFNAYDSQRVYMEKVIQCLQEVRTAFPPSNDHPPWALSDGPHRARTRCWRVPQALARRCVFCVPLLPGGSSGSTPSPTQHNPQPTSPLVRGRPWLGVWAC